MKNEQSTKPLLIITFISWYILTLLILALEKGNGNMWIFKIIPIFLFIALFVLIQKRLKEKWEKPNSLTVWISVFLLFIPLLNLFVLYDLIKDKKYQIEDDNGGISEKDDMETTNYQTVSSEINTRDIKRWLIVGWIIFWLIVLIKIIFPTTTPPDISVPNDLIAHKSPMITSAYIGWEENEYYQEFINNQTETIHTREYSKADWIDLSIQYPKSWKVTEWLRPNIITYTSSKIDDNWRSVAFNILVKDNTVFLTNDSLKRKDVATFMWEDGWKHKDAGYITLEKQPFIWRIFEMEGERSGMILYSYGLVYSTIIKDKLVQLQFFTTWNKKEWLEEYFESNIKVFDLMMNSTIINSLYK